MKTNYYNEKGELVEQKPKYTLSQRLMPNRVIPSIWTESDFEKIEVLEKDADGNAIFEAWDKKEKHFVFTGKITEGKKTIFTKYFNGTAVGDAVYQPHNFKNVQCLGSDSGGDLFKAWDSEYKILIYSGTKGDEFD